MIYPSRFGAESNIDFQIKIYFPFPIKPKIQAYCKCNKFQSF